MNQFSSIIQICKGSFVGLAIICLIVVCPMASHGGISAPRTVKITVKETNLVGGSEILLGDVAQIESGPFLKEILLTMKLGRAPKPGKIKQLNKNRLVSLIQSQPGMPEKAVVEVPEKIYVKRASQQIQDQAVKEQVDFFLSEYFKDKDYELEQFNVKNLGLYPQGTVDLSKISKANIDQKGRLSLVMDIMIDGKREDSVRISGKVAVFDIILCAKRDLAKGEILDGTDVYSVRKNRFDLRGNSVLEIQEIEGKSLKKSVKKSEPLKVSYLRQIPLIQKGDIITLVAKSNHLLIVTSGISQEDGYAGKLIRVENIKSGKIVRGLVKEKSMVEVIY